MKLTSAVLVGGGAVVASGLAQMHAPASLDFSGLPVRKYGGAAAGAYVGAMVAGHKLSLTDAIIAGVGACVAADLKSQFLPGVTFSLPFVGDAARLGAGAAAVFAASHFGLVKAG